MSTVTIDADLLYVLQFESWNKFSVSLLEEVWEWGLYWVKIDLITSPQFQAHPSSSPSLLCPFL